MKKSHLIGLMAAVYLTGVAAYTWYSYQATRADTYREIDQRLQSAALGTAFILGPEYHEGLTSKNSMKEEPYRLLMHRISQYSRQIGTAFVYSFVQVDGTIYFASTSYQGVDIDTGYKDDFMEPYAEATPLLAQTFKTHRIAFEETSDQWGRFRSILIPMNTPSGHTFVVGADIEISHVNALLRNDLLTSLLTGLYFLLLLLPLGLLYMRILMKDREILELKVKERTRELDQAVSELHKTNGILEGLSEKLSRYLSPQIRESIFTGKQNVEIHAERKKLTVFFSDIRNFTQTTEHMEPESMTRLLNHYLDEMSDIAIQHGGTIDKFIGDAVMVFFGDPESRGEKEDALACVSMAIRMRERIRELQQEWKDQGVSEPFHVRMGVNTGYCTVGNFGSNERMDYTIVGGQVNLAARLEGAAEPDQVLISGETYALVKEQVGCEEKEEIRVKGIGYPVKTYQVVDFLDRLDQGKRRIEQVRNGFSIYLDPERVKPEEKEGLVGTLKDALVRLGF